MRTMIRSMFVAAVALAAVTILAVNAGAQCSMPKGGMPSPAVFGFLEKLGAHSAAPASTAKAAEPAVFLFGPTIVGFWHSTFTAGDTVIDDGFAAWHIDGTEILNSLRDPRTGNFCMGTWQQTGPLTYKLNHFGLAWDGNGNFVGPANIQESVTLSRDGKSYSGTFTIDQYDTSGDDLAHLAGSVSGTRITVNTTPQEIYGW